MNDKLGDPYTNLYQQQQDDKSRNTPLHQQDESKRRPSLSSYAQGISNINQDQRSRNPSLTNQSHLDQSQSQPRKSSLGKEDKPKREDKDTAGQVRRGSAEALLQSLQDECESLYETLEETHI